MIFSRRTAIAGALSVAGVGLLRPRLAELAGADWPEVVASDVGFGPLGAADEWGVRVPEGFTTEFVARTGDRVGSTDHVWHAAPDGGACFPTDDGGHVYVSNSEVSDRRGGVGAVWFDAAGRLVDAASLLTGTSRNCAGGSTPWGTWLSCEESGSSGQVWECDLGTRTGTVRPAMGSFNHEAVAVDEVDRCCYLTEDTTDGRLYRFVPDAWPSLASGRLQAARVVDGLVSWVDVAADRPDRSSATTPFQGGEGITIDGRSLLFATKHDRRIWELDLASGRLSVFFDAVARPRAPLTHVDNVVVHPTSGHLFVAEDGGNMELCMLTRSGGVPTVAAVVRFVGHDSSEVAGPAFSPDGHHLYLSSQRGTDGRGVTVRVTGPWAGRPGDGPTRIDTAGSATRSAVRLGPISRPTPPASLGARTPGHGVKNN